MSEGTSKSLQLGEHRSQTLATRALGAVSGDASHDDEPLDWQVGDLVDDLTVPVIAVIVPADLLAPGLRSLLIACRIVSKSRSSVIADARM